MTPILLIILSGIFEFGFMFTNYLAVADATRNAARFSSDSQYSHRDSLTDCSGAYGTTDFYRLTACQAVAELTNEQPTITLCLPNSDPALHCPRDWDLMDDVIISVFSVARALPVGDPETVIRFPDVGEMGANYEAGWSYAVELAGGNQADPSLRTGMHVSGHTTATIISNLDPANHLNAGFLVVEVCFHYYQVLALPWFTQFISDPIPIRLHAVWPLSSAEPTSTPR
jgi:hypothetical protein